jgi:transcriptional regulator with XRE-family HTH domain
MSEIAELYRSQNYSQRVAAEVRSHAARQGIPQKDLATALGFVPSQISKRMRGTVAFTLDELATLAELFGVEPAELMPPRPPARNRAEDGAGRLPRLDLNQQPFVYPTSQVSDLVDLPEIVHLISYRNVVPLHKIHSDDDHPAKRQVSPPPYRPVILNFPNRVTA